MNVDVQQQLQFASDLLGNLMNRVSENPPIGGIQEEAKVMQ